MISAHPRAPPPSLPLLKMPALPSLHHLPAKSPIRHLLSSTITFIVTVDSSRDYDTAKSMESSTNDDVSGRPLTSNAKEAQHERTSEVEVARRV
ncbi:hypothetical protein BDZ97DRAFT_2061949 [Flammula alnicola]|nr:hypothetical protein BDZ97DRAFT_2061949 [Flammula alnicola]